MNFQPKYQLRALSLLGAGLLIGHFSTTNRSSAQAPQTPASPSIKQVSATTPAAPSVVPNAERRVVGYIYGNIPLYRDDFGEYLMARKGAEKFDLYVNKKVIEVAAAKRNITVSNAEIEAIIDQDCANIAQRSEFLKMITKNYGVSIFEWKEDVIKPRIMLYKMGKEKIDAIQIADSEIRAKYDIIHGKRVKVKVIVWPESEETMAMKAYEKLRSSEEEFDRVARNQADGTLASKGGEVLPFAKGSTGDDRLEEAAFKLKPGETSAIVKTKGRILVMRCTGYEEGAPGNYEKEKVGIEKELREKKIDREVPKIMAALLEEAKPQKFFNPPNTTEKELKQNVEKELKEAGRLNPADAKEPGQLNPAELKDKK